MFAEFKVIIHACKLIRQKLAENMMKQFSFAILG